MSKLRDFAPILIVICCAAVFGTLLMTGVIDLNTIPTLVEHRPVLAVCVVLLFFIIKGLSGVVVYNALVIVVSLIFPLPTALAINGVGTAICLSVSYWIGRRTKTESLEQKLAEHPKLQKYFSATREYGFVSCFAIHLIGLSMEVLGILFGMLRIDFWTYLASSWLAIIPGMAFDGNHNRLGRGKGYYDRFLQKISQVYKIGICFPFQLVGEIPTEETDIKMDAMIG